MSFLVIGNCRWGHGDDLATAKKNFKAQGGQLSLGYTIVEFAADQEFTGVDPMGYVHWKGNRADPVSTEVKPRKSR